MSSALEILNGNANLKSIYLLHAISAGAPTNATEKDARRFLLWCATHGRKYFDGICVDTKFFNFVTAPAGKFLSRLELFAHETRGDRPASGANDMRQAHLWYYGKVVPELGLQAFVTARERRALSELSYVDGAPDEGISLLEKLAADDRRLTLDLSDSDGRKKGKASLADGAFRSTSYWLRELPNSASPATNGVNLIGYARGTFGIGEDLRALAAVLNHADIPFVIRNVHLSDQRAMVDGEGLARLLSDRCVFPINIFCMSSIETERLRLTHGMSVFAGRYNIAYWPWELSNIPPAMAHMFDFMDEIWAMSPFLVEVFSGHSKRPVVHMPPYANVGRIEAFDRGGFDIRKDDFLCLTMADFNSFLTRKNPYGAIDAFRAAFQDSAGGERLIVKTINGHMHPAEFDRLLKYAGDDGRIMVMDGALSRAETCGLIADADCFISLHRAEGFGRPIAEAMVVKTPVLATDWSGSTSFLNDKTGYPVAYKLKDVRAGEYLFHEGSRWAEPVLDDAAAKLRSIRTNPAVALSKARTAHAQISKMHGIAAVAKRAAARLSKIRIAADLRKARR